ncbi:hypothetical protein N7457_001961, partial [Penicillium paradoxum]|uniref:uncharacterized protein n=1 Tax=Penicillium paradoxum TaxID=176176 RepID=UPI00254926A8
LARDFNVLYQRLYGRIRGNKSASVYRFIKRLPPNLVYINPKPAKKDKTSYRISEVYYYRRIGYTSVVFTKGLRVSRRVLNTKIIDKLREYNELLKSIQRYIKRLINGNTLFA